MKIVKKLRARISSLFAIPVALFATSAAQAGLPTTADPSRGATDGNFIELLQNYAFDIIVLGGLAISAVAFFIVVKNVMSKYSDVSEGKATMGEVGLQAGVGVLLLVFIIFLITQASGIL